MHPEKMTKDTPEFVGLTSNDVDCAMTIVAASLVIPVNKPIMF